MRYSFRDFMVPVMSVVAKTRVFQANNAPSMIAAAPWIASQSNGARKFPGMMPPQFQGTLVTAQTNLRGILPIDYMGMMQTREDGLNLW